MPMLCVGQAAGHAASVRAQAEAGTIPASELSEVFKQFGAELGDEECAALLRAIDCADERAPLTFDDFLMCMAVLVNA